MASKKLILIFETQKNSPWFQHQHEWIYICPVLIVLVPKTLQAQQCFLGGPKLSQPIRHFCVKKASYECNVVYHWLYWGRDSITNSSESTNLEVSKNKLTCTKPSTSLNLNCNIQDLINLFNKVEVQWNSWRPLHSRNFPELRALCVCMSRVFPVGCRTSAQVSRAGGGGQEMSAVSNHISSNPSCTAFGRGVRAHSELYFSVVITSFI